MTDLIACLSTGKGTWGHVKRVIEEKEWNKIFIITNNFGKENFQHEKDIEMIEVNQRMPTESMVEEVKKNLEGKIEETEVALNIASGSGKEHMAIIAAILKLGLGFRLMSMTQDGLKEL